MPQVPIFQADDPQGWPPRPEGACVWVHIDPETGPAAMADTLAQLLRSRPGLTVLATTTQPGDRALAQLPGAVHLVDVSDAPRAMLRRLADHWRPDAALWTGEPLPLRLPEVPQVLADARLPAPSLWRLGRVQAAPLRAMTAILTEPGPEATRLRRLGLPVETPGRLQPGASALPCNAATRDALGRALATRPVWLAVDVPDSEVRAVTEAHAAASRMAHRLLLILIPEAGTDSAALAGELEGGNWRCACRASGERAEDATQIYLAEGLDELGLWYRLAPLAYLGGTLTAPGAGRPPFEAAALGAAVIHGPNIRAHPDQYHRLDRAGAAYRITGGPELARAVERLLAPDRAADMARAGWDVVSAGAEVSDRVLDLLDEALNRAEDA